MCVGEGGCFTVSVGFENLELTLFVRSNSSVGTKILDSSGLDVCLRFLRCSAVMVEVSVKGYGMYGVSGRSPSVQ